MNKLQHLIAPLTLGLFLAGAGCKYTGGEPAPEEDAPQVKTSEAKPAEQPEPPSAPEEAAAAEQERALSEGTDEQRALMARAKKAFLNEQLGQAEKLFEQLAQTRPVSGPQVSGVIALAQIYNETGRPQEAIALYDGLQERVDDIAEVQLVIARAFAEQGESTRAIEAYNKLLDIQPDYVFAWLELGRLYSSAGREEEATKSLYTYEKRVYSMAKKLEDPKAAPADRLHILDVFSLVSDDRASQAVVEALGADEPKVRQRAASVLGETGSSEARELLERASINDPHLGVRMAAKDALERLGQAGTPADAEQPEGIGPTFVDDADELPAK